MTVFVEELLRMSKRYSNYKIEKSYPEFIKEQETEIYYTAIRLIHTLPGKSNSYFVLE